MPHTPQIHSDYLGSVFQKDKLDSFLKKAVKLVKQYDFQAFAFRGMSGALVAPVLAHMTDKTLIMVRKPKIYEQTETDESTSYHSYLRVEGDRAVERYVIIDDMVCTGRTVNSIVQAISEFQPAARCLGFLFYSDVMCGGCVKIRTHTLPTALQPYVCAEPEGWRIR
jgi:adenine/guanine phosphoribosyltransferase-like PRPP-binding protein